MKLAVVDVGNTSTAVGLWSDGRVSRVSHTDGCHRAAASSPVFSTPGVEAISYVSVVPSADAFWRRFAKSRGLGIHAVTHRDFDRGAAGISIDYPRPETIGADRLADAAGAVSRYGAPVLVMDFGTAFTAAVVTADRVWRGGAIAPGFPLVGDYLCERTAMLPRVDLRSGRVPKIGRTTEEAMRFGALVGYRGMVREIAAEFSRNFGRGFRIVATGGFAKLALAKSGLDFTIDPTLTLYGAGLLCARSA